MCDRVEGTAGAHETPIGYVPSPEDIDLSGLDIPEQNMVELLRVEKEDWNEEIPLLEEFFQRFTGHLPERMIAQLNRMKERLAP